MSDKIFKLKILYYYLYDGYISWRENIWLKDLDSHYCCNGLECGCDGQTIREIYLEMQEDRKHN